MDKMERAAKPVKDVFQILFFMYLATFLLLLALALVLYKMDPSQQVFNIWLVAVYVISGLLGGFLIGKKMRNRRFLWGLFIGVMYFMILFLVSVILKRGVGEDITHLIMTFVLCTASATVGGMIS